MHLNVEQKKLVQARPGGQNLIKGVAGSGKTTVAVYRIPFLLNNYCFAADDRILMVTFNRTLKNYIGYLYKKVEEEDKLGSRNLFFADNDKVDIETIDSIIFKYFLQFKKLNHISLEVLSDNRKKYEVIAECVAQINNLYPDVKILDQRNMTFLIDEIDWIKSCNYLELEEYQNADRLGRMSKQTGEGPQKLAKNSKIRGAIFELMHLYNKKLGQLGFVDFQDMALMALKQLQAKVDKHYTHILTDESQDLTRVQIEVLKLLYQDKGYSSFTFIADTAQSIYPHSWLVKGRSFTSIGFDMSGRSNSLSKNYRTTAQIALASYSLLEADSNIVEDEDFVRPSLIDRQGFFPIYRQFISPEQEAKFVVQEITENLLKKYTPRDIVIIAKNKSQLVYMKEILDRTKLSSILVDNREADFESQSIRLLTIHSIKGLEFKVVLIIGLNYGVIPYGSSRELEEQSTRETTDRKLLYVGMTRAHEVLYLTSSGAPSKFICDINPQYLKINSQSLVTRFYSVPLENYAFKEEILDQFSAEEKVRQWFLKELQETYKYPLSLLNVEYRVNSFSQVGLVDIAVSIYYNNNRIPYIFIEIKPLGKGIESGLAQVKSYLSHSPTCQYAIVTDGNELQILNRKLEAVEDLPLFNSSMLPTTLQTKIFFNFKHQRSFTLLSDSTNWEELTIESNTGRETFVINQMKQFPVYGNIAAGLPISISPEVEDQVYLPEDWFSGSDEYFFLKVRGDSMIGADINSGDLVLIRRQPTAQNRDIVAVTIDEDSTLKRFMKMGDSVLLIPENDTYEPIQMRSDQISIIGIAIGVLKTKAC